VRLGHDSKGAVLFYQRGARGADQRIAGAIDAHVQAERAKNYRNADAGEQTANCTATLSGPETTKPRSGLTSWPGPLRWSG
jgi:hypothetical protein